MPFSFDFNKNATLEDKKALIALSICMGQWIAPSFFRIVLPDLQQRR